MTIGALPVAASTRRFWARGRTPAKPSDTLPEWWDSKFDPQWEYDDQADTLQRKELKQVRRDRQAVYLKRRDGLLAVVVVLVIAGGLWWLF